MHLNRTGNAIQRRSASEGMRRGRVAETGARPIVRRLTCTHVHYYIIRLLLLFAFQPAHDIIIKSHIDYIDAHTQYTPSCGHGVRVRRASRRRTYIAV